jgi:predicted ATPase
LHFTGTSEDLDIIQFLLEDFQNVQNLHPSPLLLRDYSLTSVANRMGDHGENFAALIKTILKDDAAASAYTSWLKELTPAELDQVVVLPGAKRDWLFALRRNGVDYPADVLSDGTLRFAAIAAAFFQPAPPRLLLLEEIEEGLHPTRLQLLVELLKSQTGHGVEQVIATTHSPYTIAWLDKKDYSHVFLCTKDDETGATTITPFTEVPHLIEVAQRHPISDLIVQGWLETAV